MAMVFSSYPPEEKLEVSSADYELLTKAGHSPTKAQEIVFDAKRGDRYAINWIGLARDQSRKRG